MDQGALPKPGLRSRLTTEGHWGTLNHVAETTPFHRLGAENLWAIIDDFVHRMVSDSMIGFFFWNVDVPALVQREYEFTARFLGEKLPYSGRPIGRVHRPHKIRGGQFDRRRHILLETMQDHQVPADIQQEWLRHVDAFRIRIVGDYRAPDEESPKLSFRIVD